MDVLLGFRVLGFLSPYAFWPYMLNIRIFPPYVALVYIPTTTYNNNYMFNLVLL